MGDEGEYWNDIKEARRRHREAQMSRFIPILRELVESGIAVEIEYYQYRVGRTDFYPMSRKWILNARERKAGHWRDEKHLKELVKKAII